MRLELLGLEIAVRGEAGATVAAALAGMAAPGAPSSRPAIVLETELARTPQPIDGPTIFFHHPLRAARRGDAIAIGDGSSLLVVAGDGARVRASLAPEALARPEELAALHLPVALAFALRHHGVYHLHAAALVRGDGAILVAGQSGAGKTTLALALLDAGLGWLCDDAAFLAEREGVPAVAGVPRPFHVHERTLGAFPGASASAGPASAAARHDLDPEAVWPSRLRRGASRPSALLFPEVSGGPETLLSPLAPADALGRLVEASALLVVDGAARPAEHLDLLGRIAGAVPALRVELGEDLLRAPAKVARRVLAAIGP